MQKTIRHGLLALMMAAVFFLPQADSAQAASWHSPSDWNWTIDPICRNGVKITIRSYPSDTPITRVRKITMRFAANRTFTLLSAYKPLKLTGFPPVNVLYGQVSIIGKLNRTPIQWTDEESGTEGIAYGWGMGAIKWARSLSVGVPIVVKLANPPQGPIQYFLGRVNDCYVP